MVTENHQLDSELTLHDSSQSPLTVRAIAINQVLAADTLGCSLGQ
ncbi:MAG: hypothetical protein V7K50_19815 [Nostoc sp.]